jgi:hypothetical protein
MQKARGSRNDFNRSWLSAIRQRAPLNFNVTGAFRCEFRKFAAEHDLKLNELLKLCFEAYSAEHPMPQQKKPEAPAP